MEKEQILTSRDIVRLFDDREESFMERVPKIIREERVRCDLSRADLAKSSGISRPYLWQIEDARTSLSVDYLTKIIPPLGLQLVIRRLADGEELAVTPGADIAGALKRRIGLLEEVLPKNIKLRFEKR